MMSMRRMKRRLRPLCPHLLRHPRHHLHLPHHHQDLRDQVSYLLDFRRGLYTIPNITGISSAKSEKLEQLKKKPAKRPDWNDLMKEIGQFRSGHRGILNKTSTNDRSKPMLSKTKVKGVVSVFGI